MIDRRLTRAIIHARRDDGRVVLSTETPCDQDGLILLASGWDLSRGETVPFKMFYNHATWSGDPRESAPIGRWEDVAVENKELLGRPVFASEEDPERAGLIARLWEGGFIDDVSVSFVVDGANLSGPVDVEGRKFSVSNAHSLREISIVGIGADQNAGKGRLAEAVARGVISEQEARVFDPEAFDPAVIPTAEPIDPKAVDALRAELDRIGGELAALRAERTPPEPAGERVIDLGAIHMPEYGISADDAKKMVRDTIRQAIGSLHEEVGALIRRELDRQRGRLAK